MRDMPIKVCCVKRLEDERLTRVFEPGEVVDFYGAKKLLDDFPEHFAKIEMSQDDWVRHATQKALELKRRIMILKKSGVNFSSPYMRAIPTGKDEVVDGTAFGGGFPDAYYKLELLDADITSAENSLINGKDKENDNNSKDNQKQRNDSDEVGM